ncbi:MAG: laccase domain-containing protein, partial [Anaerolineae bacterium]|nr:polyphenol oxidase family protein [Caldilineales bacterium]MDW8270282.1 laccase domain-containing protein [Anaerolineae bacterium]
ADVIEAIRAGHRRTEGILLPGPRPDAAYLDLWQANAEQLREAGVQRIEIAGLCTACRRDLFFSHRGDGGRSGRFGAFIMLTERAM